METRLRHSKRLMEKGCIKEKPDNPLIREGKVSSSQESMRVKYIEHINRLHDITGDLLNMTDTLRAEELKGVINKYENIIGDLLRIK